MALSDIVFVYFPFFFNSIVAKTVPYYKFNLKRL